MTFKETIKDDKCYTRNTGSSWAGESAVQKITETPNKSPFNDEDRPYAPAELSSYHGEKRDMTEPKKSTLDFYNNTLSSNGMIDN